jgi:hypothetical protein
MGGAAAPGGPPPALPAGALGPKLRVEISISERDYLLSEVFILMATIIY